MERTLGGDASETTTIRPSAAMDEKDILAIIGPVHSVDLIAVVADAVHREQDFEEKRRVAQDQKATSIVAAVGVAISLVINFASGLVTTLPAGPVRWLAAALFLAILVVGMVTAVYAVLSLKIEPTVSVHEHNIFHPETLARADAEGGPGSIFYRKHLVTSGWMVCRRQYDLRQARALRLRASQRFFMAFLAGIVLLAVVGTALRL